MYDYTCISVCTGRGKVRFKSVMADKIGLYWQKKKFCNSYTENAGAYWVLTISFFVKIDVDIRKKHQCCTTANTIRMAHEARPEWVGLCCEWNHTVALLQVFFFFFLFLLLFFSSFVWYIWSYICFFFFFYFLLFCFLFFFPLTTWSHSLEIEESAFHFNTLHRFSENSWKHWFTDLAIVNEWVMILSLMLLKLFPSRSIESNQISTLWP